MYRPSICVIEDNDILRATLIDLLTSRQFQARGFFSLDEFLSTLSGPLPDIILADVLMEGGGCLAAKNRTSPAERTQEAHALFCANHSRSSTCSRPWTVFDPTQSRRRYFPVDRFKVTLGD